MTTMRWIAGLLLFSAGGAAGWYAAGHLPVGQPAAHGAEPHGEAAKEQSEKAADEHGPEAPHVALSAEAVEHAGITTAPLSASTTPARFAALGRLEPDPAATFAVRAPIAGMLVADPAHPWPRLGAALAADTGLGSIAPQWSPAERADLAQRTIAAEGELASSHAAHTAASQAADRAIALNKDGKNVSDRDREEAETALAAATARHTAAERNLAGLRALLGTTPPTTPLPNAPAGEVLEVLAAPGERVEQGQVLLRVVDPAHLLARVVMPLGREGLAPPVDAVLARPGAQETLAGHFAARVADGALCYTVAAGGTGVRAGQPVTAWLAAPGAPPAGVEVPGDALVRFRGGTYVFVREAAEAGAKEVGFALRAAAPAFPTPAGWFVAAAKAGDGVVPGVAAGDALVTRGADVLLSQLLRHEIPETDEPAEGK